MKETAVPAQESKQLNVRLPAELIEKAKAIAHERGMMLSGYIRTLIERDLEGEEMPPESVPPHVLAAAKAFAAALEAERR
jgi:antitoxin component of RelBE/YafQ-DinJ toxin-antitoxin module